MDHAPRIALVGAVDVAAPPARAAFAQEFPRAEMWTLLDDLLISDALAAGEVTPPLAARMTSLIAHAIDHGADGVLLTCSMYGPVAHDVARHASIPVLASDDAAFADATGGGYQRIALVASRPIPLADARRRLDAVRADVPDAPDVVDVLAADALGAGGDALVDALAASLTDVSDVDAVLLAQYSISPAADALAARLGLPVLAGPARAARHMRDLLSRPAQGTA